MADYAATTGQIPILLSGGYWARRQQHAGIRYVPVASDLRIWLSSLFFYFYFYFFIFYFLNHMFIVSTVQEMTCIFNDMAKTKPKNQTNNQQKKQT